MSTDHRNDDADHDIQIVQITPVGGAWLALFDDDLVRPVVCWALVQCVTHNKGYVAPMVSFEGRIVDATTLEGYIEAVPEEDDDMEQIYPEPGDDGDSGEDELDS